MNNLEKAKAMAQRDADRTRKPMAVYNLNRFSPLYVVRSEIHDSAVFVAQPSQEESAQ